MHTQEQHMSTMFTEALTYFVTAFIAVAGVSVVLAGIGVVLMLRAARAPRATVTAMPAPGMASAQEAA